LAVGALSVLIEHPQVNEVHVVGNSLERVKILETARLSAGASDDSGYVAAVTILIAGVRGAVPHEVLTVNDKIAVLVAQVWDVDNSAVNHGHTDPAAVVAQTPGIGGIDCSSVIVQRCRQIRRYPHRTIRRDISDLRIGR